MIGPPTASGQLRSNLLNCSQERDFEACQKRLIQALLKRGYPRTLLRPVRYDECERQRMLEELSVRDKTCQAATKSAAPLLVFKTPFNRQLRRVGIRSETGRLMRALRAEIGEAFLELPRIIVAHPVRTNMFLHMYRQNYPVY